VDLAETFSAMPNATRLGDLPGAWHWSDAPGFDMSAVVSADGKHAFQAYALDSFDEGLAISILSFAKDHSADLIAAPERPLVLAEGFAHPGYAFDAVVAVGPAIHRYYPEDAQLQLAIRALIPAFRCEFTGDEDEADAEYRYSRAAGVPGTRWGREPRPFLKMRFRGDDGRLPAERGFARPKLLVSWITRHEGNAELFVEVENYRHDVYTVEWADTWTLTAPGSAPRPVTLDDLFETLKSASYGPNIAAGTSEFPDWTPHNHLADHDRPKPRITIAPVAAPVLRAFDADGRTLDDPTDTEVHDLFSDLNARCPFAIVQRLDREPTDQFYFQIHLDYVGDQDADADEEVDVDYDVEFRDGGPDKHYRARISGQQPFTIPEDLLHKVYRAWRTGDPELMHLLPWRLLNLDGRS
jgi:hypothetical protein